MSILTATVRKTHTFSVDTDALPPQSFEKLLAYGFQQLMNDAAAPAKTDDEIKAFVQKRLDNLIAGVLRASTVRSGDPVAKEARAIATAKVTAAFKAKGFDLKHPDFKANVAKLAMREDIIALAKANVAATAEIEVDLPDLV
jgi:hypothetical protein